MQSSVPCPSSPEENGLEQPWSPKVTWCNPPYGRGIADWISKAWIEGGKGCVVVLVPPSIDTIWWHKYALFANEIRFIKGRIRFIDPLGKPSGSQTQGSALLIFRGKRPRNYPMVTWWDPKTCMIIGVPDREWVIDEITTH